MKTIILSNGKKLSTFRIKRWQKMTDENYHNQVRMEIAEFFNDLPTAKKLLELCEKVENIQSLSFKAWEKRHKLTTKLLKELEKKYGNQAAVMVWEAL